MAFTEDLTAFFDTTHGFAQSATLNGATSINVIFDAPALEAVGHVATGAPSCVARAADVGEANLGQTLVIGATTYTVREIQPEDPDGALVRVVLQAS